MNDRETLEQFYQRKFEWVPEEIKKDLGHFNVFKLEPPSEDQPHSVPYRRRDFYKVMLIKGQSRVHYADTVIQVQKQALSFSNPFIPYKWEHLDKIFGGVYCVFNEQFFNQFGQFKNYEVFKPGSPHIFELTDDQIITIENLYEKIREELYSDYKYKYDVIRNHVFELLHFALKLQPSLQLDLKPINAANRISMLFLELLERQFPIDENHQHIQFRTPSEFADQLNVHVNHLNRSVKEVTGKTTSQVIAERIHQEAKVLLKQTQWNVSEIAYALGFTEATHFTNFFKKYQELSPLKYRMQ